MFLHDPLTVNTDKLTTRELKELVQVLRKDATPTKTKEEIEELANDIVAPVFHILAESEMEKFEGAIVSRLMKEFGVLDGEQR